MKAKNIKLMPSQKLIGRKFLFNIKGKERTGKVIDFEHSREAGYLAFVWITLDDNPHVYQQAAWDVFARSIVKELN